jgi:hypothetical protein
VPAHELNLVVHAGIVRVFGNSDGRGGGDRLANNEGLNEDGICSKLSQCILPGLLDLDNHPRAVKVCFSRALDLGNRGHSAQGGGDQVAVVLDDALTAALECERAVDDKLLTGRDAAGLCPAQLARVALHRKVLAALGPAESERLAVVAHKHHPMPGVDS